MILSSLEVKHFFEITNVPPHNFLTFRGGGNVIDA
jgi:hypothetical protein